MSNQWAYQGPTLPPAAPDLPLTDPAEWVVHIPSGPAYTCDLHGIDLVAWCKAKDFKPTVAKAEPGHNCRGCVAARKQGGSND